MKHIRPIDARGADDHVIVSIAVHVPRRGHGAAELFAKGGAEEGGVGGAVHGIDGDGEGRAAHVHLDHQGVAVYTRLAETLLARAGAAVAA